MSTASTKSRTKKQRRSDGEWGSVKSGKRVGLPGDPGPAFEISERSWWIASVSIFAIGALLRLYNLNLVPLHHDEGVNGNFLVTLVRNGTYQYNPENYHGPSLYYFAAFIPWVVRFLFGENAQNVSGLTTFNIRLIPVLFGLGAIWLVLALRRQLGSIGALSAAALLVVSPGGVYLSRYFIHESLFVFFTLGIVVAAVRYYEEGHPIYLVLLGVSAGLLFATKETWIISVAVLAIALITTHVYRLIVEVFTASRRHDRRITGRDSTSTFSEWLSETGSRLSKSDGYCRIPVSTVLFSFQGRLPRAAFWTAWFHMLALSVVVWLLTAMAKASSGAGDLLALISCFAWLIFCCWVGLAIQVKRWHDLGYSGWLTVLSFIPIANLVSLVFLGFIEGTAGSNEYDPLDSDQAPSPTDNAIVILLWCVSAFAVCVIVGVLFYSSFGKNWKGVYDSLKSFEVWSKTGKEAHVHSNWTYLAKWLPFQEAPLLVFGALGAIVAVLKPQKAFALFAALWAFGIIAAYSLVPYKTPWLMLNFIVPLALIGGYAVEWVYRELCRYGLGDFRSLVSAVAAAVVLWIVVGAVLPNAALQHYQSRVNLKTFIPLYQTIDLNFWNYDNDNEYYVYIYAHTRRDLLKLVDDIGRVARRSAKPADTGITIASREYWPLPWYFRDYQRVGYYGQISPSTEPVIIGSEDKRLETDAAYGGRYRLIPSGLNPEGTYSLRPGVDLLLYVRSDLAAP